ncbi:PilN domain-containing protein [Alteromonas mediterranea]|jgi:type IV pilus assembly protein PilN|uniref:Type IV pilus biogenesis protein PilN n=3 Tax=Alteromonas mediterranea TaxID=314275 RepID=S5A8U6_9ALTE|nr:PilN domain-containing protein [Alteromonas mediterranea]AGP76777.1 type IV pilus biogenesis protein PilN [Alteromonas mediterranea 615]MBR9785968.1 PilN domain-containing protein [Gammaproteobacteria bacterium]MEA3382055.1 PilN domain-containing protein [Pseudomonadota bacterium]AEA96666.1 polysaccharide biosynthesis protein CpaD [Alteromonas mediterranea DE]AFV83994.1 type IV pilus biogenesis protein PilN [Alteromonas mediterranea DE1]|tara:strand:+ start:1179 stop:1760 length:582 start_codon:yes stop_codon:yes gene_type:complete
MAHVNLLPWREKQRQHQKQQYLAGLLAVAAIVGLIFWFIGQAIDQQINNQNSRNQYLEREIAILDAQIGEIKTVKEKKSAIEQRMALIEQLQASRNIAPIVFDELAKLVPPGVAFETMTRTNNRIEIEGVSDSNNRLSDFMRALENSKVFVAAELSTIKSDSSTARAISNFTLTFSINTNVAPLEVESSKAQK